MRRFRAIKDWSPGYMNFAPAHLDIMAECKACGEGQEFSESALPSNLQHAKVEVVEARLKCSSCGAKAGKLQFGNFVDDEEDK